MLLEFCERIGDRLELGLHPLLGHQFAIAEGLIGALEQLFGGGRGRFPRLRPEQFGRGRGLVLDQLGTGLGLGEAFAHFPGAGFGGGGAAALHQGPDQGDDSDDGGGEKGDEQRGHGPSVSRVCPRGNRSARELRPFLTYQVGRRCRMAWMMVPSSSQSSSPPTGTPRASEVISTPEPARRSAM